MAELSYAQVCAVLKYDAETGKLFWKERSTDHFVTRRQSPGHECKRWNSRYAGKEAFTSTNRRWGHRMGFLFGKPYQAHRVIWLLSYGVWPTYQIDHIDGNPANNVISNLRDVPNSVNSKNQKKKATNTSGRTGVQWNAREKKWYARININGRNTHLACSPDKEAMIKVRAAAEVEHGYSARHGT